MKIRSVASSLVGSILCEHLCSVSYYHFSLSLLSYQLGTLLALNVHHEKLSCKL